MKFNKNVLAIDCKQEVERICGFIRQQMQSMKREGAVVGLSGGIDSALIAALCVEALGKDKVFGLILPEKESSPVSREFAEKHASKLDIQTEVVDITSTLKAFGSYKKRDEVIKQILPEYNVNYKIKIVLPPDLLSRDAFNFFKLITEDEEGNRKSIRLKKKTANGIVAATNTKQRIRMLHLYYFAEKKNYFVCGTTNKSETVQGFFVKYGDGGVDIEPIAHLYKMQVFQLAKYTGVIKEIIERAPSPDTYSLPVDDEEFFFRMPLDTLDLLLYAWEHKVPMKDICESMDINEIQVMRAFRDFVAKFNASRHSRMLPPRFLKTE